jgi:hypothetical protein
MKAPKIKDLPAKKKALSQNGNLRLLRITLPVVMTIRRVIMTLNAAISCLLMELEGHPEPNRHPDPEPDPDPKPNNP